VKLVNRHGFDILEQQFDELLNSVRVHSRLLRDEGLVVLDFVVDYFGCQEVRFERNDEFARFRISDECRDEDVRIDDQSHPPGLLRLFLDALQCALIDFGSNLVYIFLCEFTVGSQLIQ
jgi:hypothetical protein